MFGFILGFACLIGLIMVLKGERRRRRGGWGMGGGCGRGHGHWHGGWHGGIGRNPFLRQMFHRLDTTPGQEKAIRHSLEGFFETMKSSKQSLWGSRKELATVFRSEAMDESSLANVIARHDEVVENVRTKGVDTLTEIYQTLDQQQRERVAKWLESGPSTPPGGPYRTAGTDEG